MASALTISVDDALLARVDALARDRAMSREAVVAAALSSLLVEADGVVRPAFQDWQADKIRQGIADVDRGAVVGSAEISRIVRSFD